MRKIVFTLLLIPVAGISFAQSVSACTDLSTNLSRGADSKNVLALQNFLYAKGLLKAAPNGYFGPATAASVKAYQKNVGLAQVGNTGPATRAAIKKDSCGKVSVATSTLASSSTATIASTTPVVTYSRPILSSITKGTLFTGGLTAGTTTWKVTLNGSFSNSSSTVFFTNRGTSKKYTIGLFSPASSTTILLPMTIAQDTYPCGTGCNGPLSSGDYDVTVKNEGGESNSVFLSIKDFSISSLSGTLSVPLKQKSTSVRLGTISFGASVPFYVAGMSVGATAEGLSKNAVSGFTFKDEVTGKAITKFGSDVFVGENQSKIIGIYGSITSTSSGRLTVSASTTIVDFVGKKPVTFMAPSFLTSVSGF